jgi:hypothetical protein
MATAKKTAKKEETTQAVENKKAETTTDQYSGSRNAIRNTMRRHEEVRELSTVEFEDVQSKNVIVLGAEQIVCKSEEGNTLGTVPYGKSQFRNTALLCNKHGGGMLIKTGGASKTAGTSQAVNTALKSLEGVLRNNGFVRNTDGVFEKDGFSVPLSDEGWELKDKAGETIKAGKYGRGAMKAIRDAMAPKAEG